MRQRQDGEPQPAIIMPEEASILPSQELKKRFEKIFFPLDGISLKRLKYLPRY